MQTGVAGGVPVGERVRKRKGLALLIVMVALSASLVLTYSFLRTQTIVARISDNGARRDLALQAAQAGAADGLARLQTPDWQGIDHTITEVLIADTAGTASYSVVYLTLSAAGVTPLPSDEPLYLLIRSTGLWQSALNSQEIVQRQVDVTVRLTPRLPGRILRAGDLSSATDVTPNPGDYDRIQTYTLFAKPQNLLHSTRPSLDLDPRGRIDGDVWLAEKVRLYKSPHWGSTVRKEMLASIGTKYGPQPGATGISHPHPLAGTVTSGNIASDSSSSDLNRLKITHSLDASTVAYPSVDPPSWQTYRLYAGGPVYAATPVLATLSNVTLGPTSDNPLGIFYHNGTVLVSNNVTIQGTLVSNSLVTLSGNEIRISGYNWLDQQGQGLVPHANLWPRLPAIVADGISISRSVRVVVDGAIVVRHSLNGAGGDFEWMSGTAVSIAGAATSRPLKQPYSSVQLHGAPDLTGVSDTGIHSIWLQDGSTGNWYPIVGVDRIHSSLTVVGEVRYEAATTYRIGRTRLRYVDLRGPVFGETVDIKRPPAWGIPSAVQWDQIYSDWQVQNVQRAAGGLAPLSFVDRMADPANFVGWTYPLSVYGLGLEPTFHLRNTTGIMYRWSPPLFTPYPGNQTGTTFAGYRWQVSSWREVR